LGPLQTLRTSHTNSAQKHFVHIQLQPAVWTVALDFPGCDNSLRGLIGFLSRLRYPPNDKVSSTRPHRALYAWPRREATPCINHERRRIIWKNENAWYLLWSFAANASTAVHLVFGIATLGSVQLVGAANAGIVIGRFLASALVCRCVLMFELAGLRERLEVSIEDDVTERTGAKPLQPTRNEATSSSEQAVQEVLRQKDSCFWSYVPKVMKGNNYECIETQHRMIEIFDSFMTCA
jgi:hypothetical protein